MLRKDSAGLQSEFEGSHIQCLGTGSGIKPAWDDGVGYPLSTAFPVA